MSGALGAIGINPQPIGTLAELEARGLDKGACGSCAPPPDRSNPDRRGCHHWHDCVFRFERYGGFRGKDANETLGPANVGYYVKTFEGSQMENDVSCFAFMQTMSHRLESSERNRDKYANAEIVEIVAMEPRISKAIKDRGGKEWDTHVRIRQQVRDPKDPKVWDTGGVGNWLTQVTTKEVPNFPRPTDRNHSPIDYDAQLMERHRQRASQDEARRIGMPSARPKQIEADDPDTLEFGAAPVKTEKAKK